MGAKKITGESLKLGKKDVVSYHLETSTKITLEKQKQINFHNYQLTTTAWVTKGCTLYGYIRGKGCCG